MQSSPWPCFGYTTHTMARTPCYSSLAFERFSLSHYKILGQGRSSDTLKKKKRKERQRESYKITSVILSVRKLNMARGPAVAQKNTSKLNLESKLTNL